MINLLKAFIHLIEKYQIVTLEGVAPLPSTMFIFIERTHNQAEKTYCLE